MASSLIHIAIAKKVNEVFKRDLTKFLIGSIAPDISKLIGESKEKSHFLDKNSDDLPNLDLFLKKYKNNLNDDFVLGYYIHLYTDYLWFKYFISEIVNKDCVRTLDGSLVKIDKKTIWKYIYDDYTNLNIQLVDKYDLDLKIFYNELPDMEPIIEEIPMHKLNIVVDKTYEVINKKIKVNLMY